MFKSDKHSKKLINIAKSLVARRTVKIDEAKFGRRKYNRGRFIKGNWILGGYERDMKKIFFVPVEDRTEQTVYKRMDITWNNCNIRLLEIL